MKLLLLTPQRVKRWAAGTRPRRCPLCQRNIRPGQYVLNHRLPGNDFTDPVINMHVSCLRAAIADVPPDEIDPTDPQALWQAERAKARADARADRSAA